MGLGGIDGILKSMQKVLNRQLAGTTEGSRLNILATDVIIHLVKKLFVIFLLLVMPLQASWAVVATYCQHEQDVTAQHLGHHEHAHEHDSDASDKDSSNKRGADAHDCHGHTVGLLVIPFTLSLNLPSAVIPQSSPSRLASGLSSPPERPQWPLVA